MNDKAPSTTEQTTSPSLSIDWEIYLDLLEESDMSETDKRALIETLWSIIVSFVDLGFNLNPVQQACGQIGEGPETLSITANEMLKSQDKPPPPTRGA